MRDNDERVLFVLAHPMDESLYTGGAIAQTIASGSRVTVVTCTRGELGSVIQEEFAAIRDIPEAVTELREHEVRTALAALGVTDHRYLGSVSARRTGLPPREYRDSGLTWSSSAGAAGLLDLDPRALCAAPIFEIIDDLRAVVASVTPTALVSYGPKGVYGHPDQLRVHKAVQRLAADLDIPFFQIDFDAQSLASLELDVLDVFDAKCTAVAAHRSQLTVVGDHYTTRDGQSGRVPALERYRLDRRGAEELRPSWPQPGGSLGTFVLAAVLAVIAGVAVGALSTLVHQSSWLLGGTEVPVGIVLGALALGSLLVGLRLIWASRALAGLAGGAALVVTLLLSTVSRGGSVLVPNNAAGVVWTLSAGLIVAIAIAWPRPGTLRALRRLRAASGTSLAEGGIMDTQPPRKGRRSL